MSIAFIEEKLLEKTLEGGGGGAESGPIRVKFALKQKINQSNVFHRSNERICNNHELRVASCELESTSWNPRVAM